MGAWTGRLPRDLVGLRARFRVVCCAWLVLCCQRAPQGADDAGFLRGLKRWLAVTSAPSDGGARSPVVPSPQEVELRRRMFERLVSEIRKYHVFSSVWPEVEWAKDLPALERELLEAPERESMLRALCHLSNALRDGHLTFSPCTKAASAQPGPLMLPLAFAQAGSYEAPHFVVTQVGRASALAPGDELLDYDGVPSEALLEHFRFELNGAQMGVRLDQLTGLLQARYGFEQLGLTGTGVAVTVRHGAGLVREKRQFAMAQPQPAAAGPQTAAAKPALVAVPPARACPALARDYAGEYELVEVGAHVCLYRASRPPFEAYPIVRQISFLYAREELAADHTRVQEFLAQTPHLSGVLLDLRDNGGGRAADHFLPWYSSGVYRGANEWVHLHGELGDRVRLRRALRSDAAVDEYLRRAASGDAWWVRPFDCDHGDCQRARAGALRRVSSAPVALLLGPGCASSCDTFAAIWTREHFGPSVGTPPAAMYTSLRYPLEVSLGHEFLGDFEIALCGMRLDDNEPWLEGRPLGLDSFVEPRWPQRSYDRLLLDAAIRALSHSPGGSARGSSG